jgi:hypothetical protein
VPSLILLTAQRRRLRLFHQWLIEVEKHFIGNASLPGHMNGVCVVQLVKNPIAAQDYEVMPVLVNLKSSDIRIRDHDPRIAIELWQLGLDVAEGSADRKSAREHAVRTQHQLALNLTILLLDIDD